MLLVTLFVQVLFSFLPGSAAEAILGEDATPEAIAALNEKLGTDLPLWQQYFTWLGNLLRGDLGTSPINSQPVAESILARLPVTVELAVLALGFAILVSLIFALASASKPGGLVDRGLNALSSVLLSLPVFVLAPLLIFVFAIQLHLLPPLGWVPISEDLGQNLRYIALPVLAISIGEIAEFHRILRADLITTLHEDYVGAARAKGLPPLYVMIRHALRPASLSLVTVIGVNLGRLLGGTVLVETLFSLPGLGNLAITSIQSRDVIMVQGVVAFIAIVYVGVNTVVDLSYGLLDPRIRRRAWA